MEWSETIRQSNLEDFVGVFDGALGSRVSNEFSLSELGGVGQAVDMSKNDFASTEKSSSTTSRMAVSMNGCWQHFHKLTSLLCSV
jgi:hypothetical protein